MARGNQLLRGNLTTHEQGSDLKKKRTRQRRTSRAGEGYTTCSEKNLARPTKGRNIIKHKQEEKRGGSSVGGHRPLLFKATSRIRTKVMAGGKRGRKRAVVKTGDRGDEQRWGDSSKLEAGLTSSV